MLAAEIRQVMGSVAPPVWRAALVHLLTASGAVCGFLALRAVSVGAWEAVFAWLGLGLLIDGVDGTFARMAKVTARLPRFSGERLDLVVDYLNYVFVPAFALLQAGFLRGPTGVVLCAGILLSSLFHFADTQSKAADHCFIGFPAIWNVVAFYVFSARMSSALASLLAVIGILLTFVPMRWVHPLRTARLLPLTLLVVLVWSLAAAYTLLEGFPARPPLLLILGLAAGYGIGLTLFESARALSRAS
jgi:phosphatidylcholine synthase